MLKMGGLQREMATFKSLFGIKGFDPKLDGTTFLDLGSGDQFFSACGRRYELYPTGY